MILFFFCAPHKAKIDTFSGLKEDFVPNAEDERLHDASMKERFSIGTQDEQFHTLKGCSLPQYPQEATNSKVSLSHCDARYLKDGLISRRLTRSHGIFSISFVAVPTHLQKGDLDQ